MIDRIRLLNNNYIPFKQSIKLKYLNYLNLFKHLTFAYLSRKRSPTKSCFNKMFRLLNKISYTTLLGYSCHTFC